ncbi:WH2 domain-containing protein [Wolbachia endosymbiont of Wuchereria bancrofti]|uniref:hypothetical protein n=1 Tax=Wolbachia endosymbiont of Wuchereria bancrofti TaxID=96496 RepID=UPI000B4D35D3|nr:hypothetical protein [Wolbachia endosymbiont of Wuchereria bancrofti]OWZ25126.1 wAS family protein [Wolbachia endosymbiont of Wuchereria bancrofti]
MRISNFGPLIAILSSSVLSFTAGQYFPYVIAAVSGSSATTAAPLAIFAVSMVIALVSAAYLIKLAVSIAGNKKGAGPSREALDRSGQQCTVFQGLTQESVCKNGALKNELNKHISFSPSSPICGTRTFSLSAPLLLNNAPPPLLPLPLSQNAGAAPPPPPPPLFSQISLTQPSSAGLFAGVKNAKLRKASGPVKTPKYDDSRNAMLKQIRQGTKLLTKEERDEKLKRQAAMKDNKKEQSSDNVGGYSSTALFEKLKYRRLAIEFSDSESDRSNYSDNGDWSDRSVNKQKELREKKLTKRRGKSTSSNSQPYDEKSSATPSSGYISDDDADQQEPETATSSNCWSNKKEPPPVPPKPNLKCVSLQKEPPPVPPKPNLKCVNLQKESKAFLIKQ